MSKIEQLITEHIDIWTSAILAKSTAGRGSNKKYELYGIKKLRELILELAVRGKLVPQDPSDEPASVLLERIAAERVSLTKEKKIKKKKILPEVDEDERFFELPVGWEWLRLNDIGDWGAGATPSRSNSSYYGGDIPWFKSGELSEDYISVAEESVTQLALEKVSLRSNKPGDVLLAMYGATIGKASILSVAATTNQAVCACTPFSGISNVFLLTLLKAYRPIFIDMGAGGAQPNISREKIIATVIALPPEEEQQRIVAKVDELMLLCDQLEQQTETSIDAHATLVEVLLATLTDSADANELAQNWARVSEHFATLFTTEQSIETLKQTLLQLAVMGKLVPQDPNDEPAAVLLEKIAAEKEQLIKDKKIKKEKPLPPIGDDEKPFELPVGWEWCRAGDVSYLKGGFAYKSQEFLDAGTHQVIRMGNIRPDYLRLDASSVFIPSAIADNTEDYQLKTGDIILTMTGTKGKKDYLYSLVISEAHLEQQKLYLNQRLCRMRPSLVNVEFLNMALKDERILMPVFAQSTGSANQANIGMVAISNWALPVPPLSEQHRIIIKVDELMQMCDQLKTNLQQSQETQVQLTDALINQALG